MRDKFEEIIDRISKLEILFQENKAIILSEDDLKCLVFHNIYDLFNHNTPTFNSDIKGSPLHSELKFFNKEGKLFFRPDILIFKPENYSIKHSIAAFKIKNDRIIYEPTSSKEFEFCGDIIIIELKFCKAKDGIKNIKSFQNDLDKMESIKRLVESDGSSKVLGLLVIFNKTDKKTSLFNDFFSTLQVNSDIVAKYYFGMVKF